MSRTVSQYFNNINAKNEQRLVEDLIVESIRICGMTVYYVPRTLVDFDSILGEDPMSSFTKVYPIEMYFDQPSGFQGDRDILSKFGLEMRDQTSFIVARRRFTQAVRYDGSNAIPQTQFTANTNYVNEQQTQYTANEVRPLEGDLIYLPVTNDIFEITFADHESAFHQLGAVFVWRISVKKFAYSSETIQTGIPQIDRVSQIFENQDSVSQDTIADNPEIKTEVITDIDFDETNPFGEPDGYSGPTNFEEGDFQDGSFQ
jgi:hypothetical protein